MKMNTLLGACVGSVAAVGLLLVAVPPAHATLDIQKKAKAAGFEAANCQYCHNEKLPKKDAVTHNDRGKWLLAQKEAKKAKEIDVSWLKGYTPPK
jgi:hypothetical protein